MIIDDVAAEYVRLQKICALPHPTPEQMEECLTSDNASIRAQMARREDLNFTDEQINRAFRDESSVVYSNMLVSTKKDLTPEQIQLFIDRGDIASAWSRVIEKSGGQLTEDQISTLLDSSFSGICAQMIEDQRYVLTPEQIRKITHERTRDSNSLDALMVMMEKKGTYFDDQTLNEIIMNSQNFDRIQIVLIINPHFNISPDSVKRIIDSGSTRLLEELMPNPNAILPRDDFDFLFRKTNEHPENASLLMLIKSRSEAACLRMEQENSGPAFQRKGL